MARCTLIYFNRYANVTVNLVVVTSCWVGFMLGALWSQYNIGTVERVIEEIFPSVRNKYNRGNQLVV